jgi:CubicO group peptidase (beta-lactamase class C family)
MNEKKKKSVWRKIGGALLVLLLLANIAILASGKLYLYKAIYYNYADIDDLNLFVSRQVPKGAPQEWPVASDYNKKSLPEATLKELEKNKSVAFLVIKDDSIRYEQYWDHYDQSSLSNSFSMAKSFVSVLIGVALDEGKIKSLDEPVGNYIPHFKEGANAELTIRQLLMMSSGLNWNESYSSLFSVTTEAYYGTDLAKLVNNMKVVSPRGKKFDYMSGNTLVLGMIVEKATGMKLAEYASEKLWKPMGAVHAAEWSLDHKDGIEKSFCCFYSNARDFARFGKLYLDSGMWNGKQLVSKQYVRESLTPAQLDFTGNELNCYGYQWWITEERGHHIFYCRGLNGQYIVVIPDQKIIFVRLGNKREPPNEEHKLVDLPIYIDGVLDMYGSQL